MRPLESATHSSLARLGGHSHLPLRPRFLHELVVIPVEEGFVVEGSNRPYILAGDATKSLFPRLVGLMDGSRTLDQIRRELPGTSVAKLHATISLLLSWGMIEDDEAAGPNLEPADQESLAFFRRYAGATRTHRAGRAAYEALRASEVVLLCRDNLPQLDTLKSLLQQSGIGRIVALHLNPSARSPVAMNMSGAPSLGVSVSLDGEDYERHAWLDDWCHSNGLPWLRAVLDVERRQADIGPLFNSTSACYCCFHALHGHSGAPEQLAAGKRDPGADAQFLMSLLAVEVIYWLSRLWPRFLWRDFQRYELTGWNSRSLRWMSVPGCARCRPYRSSAASHPADASQTLIDTSVIFEDYMGLAVRPDSLVVSEQPSQSNIELDQQTSRLANCARLELNRSIPELKEKALEVVYRRGGRGRQSLTTDDVAALLVLTGGIRSTGPDKLQRWCATAGNLGSVELFIAARRVAGLSPGIYFYQAADHSLAEFQLHRETLKVDDFMRSIDPTGRRELPDAFVLLIGAFHRVAWKYSHFGYRLIYLDAGVAMSQLHMVAAALNICSRTLTRWRDDLVEEHLNLKPLQQQVTAIVGLSATPDMGREVDFFPAADPLSTGLPPSTKGIREFSGIGVDKVLQMLFRESRLQGSDLRIPSIGNSDGPRDVRAERELTKTLPPPFQGGRSVGEILSERSSVRHYAFTPLSLSQLGSMLYCAYRGDLSDWPLEQTQELGLSFLVLASRVRDLDPGVYWYMGEDHGLRLSRPALAVDTIVELFVQPDFASAPVVIWITGNLAASSGRYGAFGHRQLLVRAGAAANRLWEAAMGMDLAGCIVAGVVPGAARLHLGLDGYQEAGLVAFSVGNSGL